MLIIVRGLPGAGKSTVAKQLHQMVMAEGRNVVHSEADKFFETVDGYKFDRRFLTTAHNWCQGNTIAFLRESLDNVAIVSNTFTQMWEADNYAFPATALGHAVMVLECCRNFGSIHSVPTETLDRMKARYMAGPDFATNLSKFGKVIYEEIHSDDQVESIYRSHVRRK